jgi:hypothetical protein
MRAFWNDGQEILDTDLSDVAPGLEKQLYERVVYHLLGKNGAGFFQDSFKVDFVDNLHVQTRAGLGLQLDGAQTGAETARRPMWRGAAVSLTVTTPDPANPRIDIVVVKAALATAATENRNIKDANDGSVSELSMVVKKDWQADVLLVAGTPNVAPVAPAVPAGYVKVAEVAVAAVTGVAGSGSITDSRTLLPAADEIQIDTTDFSAVATQALGVSLKTVLRELDDAIVSEGTLAKTRLSHIYDAIVGSASYCTHADIQSAHDALAAGSKILVVESLAVAAPITISKNNIEIELKPGVTLSKSGSNKCFDVTGDGFKLHGGRLSGWNGVGEKAVLLEAAADYAMVYGVRFADNAAEIDDQNETGAFWGNITE